MWSVACGQHRSSRFSTSPWILASCLVLGAWCLELAVVPNQEDRLSTWPGPGGSCSLLGDVWPWLRAELFQHQPSSTPISRHGKGTGPPSGVWAPQGLDPRAAAVVRRGCRWLKILHVSFRAVFLACDSGVSRLISSRCHAIRHDDQSLQCHASLNIRGNWVHQQLDGQRGGHCTRHQTGSREKTSRT